MRKLKFQVEFVDTHAKPRRPKLNRLLIFLATLLVIVLVWATAKRNSNHSPEISIDGIKAKF